MKTPYTIGVGWLLTLVATLLLCISGLYWANVRTMNASIDRVIQETFDGVMLDVGQALQSNPQALNNAQCALASQQMLERTHAQLEPVLRVSVARGGRIWCDSDTSTIGTTVPDTWPKAPAMGQKPQVFKTEQLTGAELVDFCHALQRRWRWPVCDVGLQLAFPHHHFGLGRFDFCVRPVVAQAHAKRFQT